MTIEGQKAQDEKTVVDSDVGRAKEQEETKTIEVESTYTFDENQIAGIQIDGKYVCIRTYVSQSVVDDEDNPGYILPAVYYRFPAKITIEVTPNNKTLWLEVNFAKKLFETALTKEMSEILAQSYPDEVKKMDNQFEALDEPVNQD